MNTSEKAADLKSRIKRVDLESLPEVQREVIMEIMSKKITKIFSDAVGGMNRILNIYGLQAHMVYTITPIGFDLLKECNVLENHDEIKPVEVVPLKQKSAKTIKSKTKKTKIPAATSKRKTKAK